LKYSKIVLCWRSSKPGHRWPEWPVTRQQAVEIGKQFQLSPRTVDDILHNATGKALEKLKAGHYRKI
jgi:hypothetical protein